MWLRKMEIVLLCFVLITLNVKENILFAAGNEDFQILEMNYEIIVTTSDGFFKGGKNYKVTYKMIDQLGNSISCESSGKTHAGETDQMTVCGEIDGKKMCFLDAVQVICEKDLENKFFLSGLDPLNTNDWDIATVKLIQTMKTNKGTYKQVVEWDKGYVVEWGSDKFFAINDANLLEGKRYFCSEKALYCCNEEQEVMELELIESKNVKYDNDVQMREFDGKTYAIVADKKATSKNAELTHDKVIKSMLLKNNECFPISVANGWMQIGNIIYENEIGGERWISSKEKSEGVLKDASNITSYLQEQNVNVGINIQDNGERMFLMESPHTGVKVLFYNFEFLPVEGLMETTLDKYGKIDTLEKLKGIDDEDVKYEQIIEKDIIENRKNGPMSRFSTN